tara:strand:- start:2710 stop:3054 length:345 start_codon:yes stop_codon:yes gene_type:complete
MNKDIVLCLMLLWVSQLAVWFQLNGQFIWKWFEKNPLLLSLAGVPIGYGFILATKYGYSGFDGQLWPQRLLGFALGIMSFAFCTYWFLGEGLSSKTFVSLVLAVGLVLIQIFWK